MCAHRGYHLSVQVLASLGLVALGLVIGFRAGIHWERVGRKVDELARTESVPAAAGTAEDCDVTPSQRDPVPKQAQARDPWHQG